MGLFTSAGDPDNPAHLAIAAHELGHAWAWSDGGLQILSITFTPRGGHVRTHNPSGHPPQLIAEAVGLWAGFEAEDRWLREHRLGKASRGNSSHDIRAFRSIQRLMHREYRQSLTERSVRASARAAVNRHWAQIQHAAPALVKRGRITL
ncbi:hypothetical protein AMES_6072 [Amycolatopsis mediterranei S699]|uniref:Uncharacterized protein n=2 Tax=Amycolatopsis mediterranei TaxID=33910 RepID=A0A0H3DCF6_AMYMU|nr:hypothetical protein [Amycolatopsis mediterranei]ADJ47897.1 hypothetical protein AMED_6161 [Amycolatopsis mediterranei U32]AEK44792.1 hypothetical protein RAM_31585 [Amycolatopsis mediterranei S699]AFO79608.1 hypothetical protein AMES_6072 [Amycolatopsis mediterranei S699]AGT86736.1 hypothetical protein B737_6072 [Amycolatopsis mediterranei RB]UZF72904.1 hypothetical protein ISP_006301 [Amycolatopsis mediterranei]